MAARLKVLVDSSVWIAILRGQAPWDQDFTASVVQARSLIVADLVYVEVVRGAKTKAEAKLIEKKFDNFSHVSIGGIELAKKAVENFQVLRSKGLTVRGTVDLIIATWCIENNIPLLHADRDFDGFEAHLGLKRWPTQH